MTPYETDKIKEAAQRLFETCMEINGYEERFRNKTGNKPTAFFSFSGHTNAIYMQISPDGWASNTDTVAVDKVVYLSGPDALTVLKNIQDIADQYMPDVIAEKEALTAQIDEKRAELEKLYEEFTRRFPNADDL